MNIGFNVNYRPFVNATVGGCVKAKEWTREACYILNDFPTSSGIEKLTKAALSNMEALSEFSRFKGVFDETLPPFRGLKDVYYATKILNVPQNYFKVNGVKLPSLETMFLDVASVCETYKFMQKYQICSFAALSSVASQIGQVHFTVPLFGNVTLNDVPVVSGLLNRPKEMFAFTGFSLGVYNSVTAKGPVLTFDNALKWTQNIGKMILIAAADTMKAHGYRKWTILIDVVASNAAIVAMIWKSHNNYQKFFHPGVRGMRAV